MPFPLKTEVEGMIGAGCHERTLERATYRNGDRDLALVTRVGSLQLGCCPSFGSAAIRNGYAD